MARICRQASHSLPAAVGLTRPEARPPPPPPHYECGLQESASRAARGKQNERGHGEIDRETSKHCGGESQRRQEMRGQTERGELWHRSRRGGEREPELVMRKGDENIVKRRGIRSGESGTKKSGDQRRSEVVWKRKHTVQGRDTTPCCKNDPSASRAAPNMRVAINCKDFTDNGNAMFVGYGRHQNCLVHVN